MPRPNGARSITVLLEGLRCSACSWLADKALHLQSGVLDVSVNPATARARLVWEPSKVRLGDLLRVLEHVGLRPHPLAGEPAEQIALLERRSALKRLAVAGFGMMQVMMFALPLYVAHKSGMEPGMREFFRLVSMLVSIPVAFYSGWPFYQGAWHALRARSVSMDVPVTLGIVIAFVASVWNALTGHGEVYFDSVTMFVFFLSLGRYVEMVARHRAGSVADALARLAPVTARRVRDDQVEDVQASELQPGDEMLVRTGEVFAADGVVAEGTDGRVDESMLTGESTAISKHRGSPVHAGTQNLGAPLRVRVAAVAGNTVLAGIVALLERAQAERPRLAKAADRAAAWFLSRILVGSALVFIVWWFVDPVAGRSRDACRAGSDLSLRAVARHACRARGSHRGSRPARRAGGTLRCVRIAGEGDARAVGQDGHAHARPRARRRSPAVARREPGTQPRTGGSVGANVRAPDRQGIPGLRRHDVHRNGRGRDRGSRSRGPRRWPAVAHRHAGLRTRLVGARGARRDDGTSCCGKLGLPR